MLNNQTLEKLFQLRMPAMADSYRRMSENPDFSSLPVDDVLGLIVDAEWTSRYNKRIKRLQKISCLPSEPSIEDIDYKPERMLDKQMLATLSDCSWILNSRNLILTGKTGTGKSYLACAIGNMACRLNYSVKYYRLPRLLTDLSVAKIDGSYNRYLSNLKKNKLLILDDWGLAEITANDSRDILEMIEDKTNTGSLILSSQIPVSDWYQLFTDPTLADACMDRLVHNSYQIEIQGDSMRKRSSKED